MNLWRWHEDITRLIISISIIVVIALSVIFFLIYRSHQRQKELEAQINDLIEKIDSGDWITKNNATYELKDIGCEVIPFLVKAANDSNSENPQRFIELIKNFRFTSDDCVQNLGLALRDTNSRVRVAAIHALAYINVESSAELLATALNDEDSYVKRKTLEYLAIRASRNEIFVDPIIEILNSETDCDLLIIAMAALASHGDQASAEVLIPFLNHDSLVLRGDAAFYLGRLKIKAATIPIINLLSDSSMGVRIAAVQSLGDMDDKRAIEPLLALLQRKGIDIFEAEAIMLALGKLGMRPETDSLAPD